MEIKKPYNSYQEAKYKICYSTSPRKRIKASHYCCYYGDKCLNTGKSYALCQEDLKLFRQMNHFTDKTKLKIKPAKN